MDKFDIYWYDYQNSDGTKKTRPVLILDTDTLIPLAEITSHSPRSKYDYQIEMWKEAGLIKPSVIRFDKIQFAYTPSLGQYIGHLSQKDIDKIIKYNLV